MWFMALISTILFCIFVFILMVARSCLQWEDKSREMARDAAAIRSLSRAREAKRGSMSSSPQAD
ncbi:unnamed protein product [Effrenium voratum]|uniref:Uncharacterized protein n=1 Tax=Effrenium voratum TaxID=2562239 RepID=A0AA36N653_9DINO|nr:unnamed protein product [Effrenium voratum]